MSELRDKVIKDYYDNVEYLKNNAVNIKTVLWWQESYLKRKAYLNVIYGPLTNLKDILLEEDEFDNHLVAKGMESDIDMELVALDECLEELNKLNYLSDEIIASKYNEYEKFWEEI